MSGNCACRTRTSFLNECLVTFKISTQIIYLYIIIYLKVITVCFFWRGGGLVQPTHKVDCPHELDSCLDLMTLNRNGAVGGYILIFTNCS